MNDPMNYPPQDGDQRAMFAPLKKGPRPGFALRVMARLDQAAQADAASVLAWTWPKLAVPMSGALVAVVLFFAAFRMPEPTWLDADKTLASLENSQWSDAGSYQVATAPESDHE